MKHFWVLCIALPLAAANVPNRYIVELSTAPVATVVRGKGRFAIHSLPAEQHRTRVRSEQATARARILQAEGAVTGAVENIQNALVVRIDDAKAGRLASLPGVRKVYPVRTFHLMLDHALPLHRVPEAWTQVGIGNAGAGVKIAIIDSGVDIAHPGFQDGGFTAPAGFPRGDTSFTNNKVIVARTYVDMLPHPDPDLSGADHVGHGTATAMAAAGVQTAGPLATISGVAPRAYIGNYKVFGTPSANESTTEDAVLRAIDDAVADGMDVINLSLGTDLAMQVSEDPEMQALENAAALGIVVVCAAGNNGSDPMTTGSPAGAPSVIAVGASANDRIFSARVLGPGGKAYPAFPGAASGQAAAVTAKVADVAALDGNGLACAALPAGALAGTIALISRGTCNFDVKLGNAQAAGAAGAVVYNNVDGAPVAMSVTSATLPAAMISMADGLALRQQLTAALQITIDFALAPLYADPGHLESFSAAGPNVDFSIKPDMVAVGGSLYLAAEKLDPKGVLYNPSGYAVESGTSFSSPIVAGAAALLKAARPGLTAAQYRSLLVNTSAPAWSAPGTVAHVQKAGAGRLDLLAAINSTAAAAPVSLSFGASSGTVQGTRSLTLWNLGTQADTFQLSVTRLGGNAVPEVGTRSVQVAPGGSVSVPVSFSVAGLAPGEYEGFIEIQGTRSNTTSRVPYWYGVSSGQPRHITVLLDPEDAKAGASVTNGLLFRVTDESGVPLMDVRPSVQVVSGEGAAGAPRLVRNVPYAFDATMQLGARPGPNVFRIQAGDLTKDVTIIGQ